MFELAGGGVLVLIGMLLVTGMWDGLLNHLRVWAGSVNLPL
jgi:cytochrome c-type biogenesis protein